MKNKCNNHPEKDSLGICNNCKRHFCSNCLIEGEVYYYCKDTQCIDAYNREIHFHRSPQFCVSCLESTTAESIGDLTSVNFIGSSYVDEGAICPLCGSRLVKKAFILFGIPILRSKDTYRLKRVWNINKLIKGYQESYLSRKLK